MNMEKYLQPLQFPSLYIAYTYSSTIHAFYSKKFVVEKWFLALNSSSMPLLSIFASPNSTHIPYLYSFGVCAVPNHLNMNVRLIFFKIIYYFLQKIHFT